MFRRTAPKIWKEFIIKDKKIQIKSLTKERIDEAIGVLDTDFYPHENLSIATDMISNPAACKEFSNFMADTAKEGKSLIAVEKTTDSIVGLMINSLTNPTSHEQLEIARDSFKEENSTFLLNCLIELELMANIFTKYNVNCYFNGFAAAVDVKYRGKNIATELIDCNYKLVKSINELDIEFKPRHILGLATCKATSCILNKLGYKMIHQTPFSIFNFNGKWNFSEKINIEKEDQGLQLFVKTVY